MDKKEISEELVGLMYDKGGKGKGERKQRGKESYLSHRSLLCCFCIGKAISKEVIAECVIGFICMFRNFS